MHPNPNRQRLLGAEIKRPKTNLVPATQYELSPEQMKTGFMGVFTKKYPGDARRTLLKIAFAPLMDMTAMSVKDLPAARSPEDRRLKKDRNQSIKDWEDKRTDEHLAQFTTLKKVNDGKDSHFLLAIPVAQVSSTEGIERISSLFDGAALTEEGAKEFNNRISEEDRAANKITNKVYPSKSVLSRAGLSDGTRLMFSQCMVGVLYRTSGNFTTIFLEFKIPAQSASYLVSEDWMSIRPVDLYPLFTMWVESEFVPRLYGKSSISMSKIARTLPPHIEGDERVDSNNIGISLSGEPLWIPADCDNTDKYESQYSASGTQANGEFALRMVGSQNEVKLPINIPILVDWVNNKFTYSSSVGKPVIMDLAHVRKCNSSMAMNLLKREAILDYIKTLSFYAQECKMNPAASWYGADPQVTGGKVGMTMLAYAQMAFGRYYQEHNTSSLRWLDVMEQLPSNWPPGTTSKEMILAPVARWIVDLAAAMETNIEALYVKYAVITMTEALGRIKMLASYGSDLTKTTSESNTINEPATSQGIDPNWTPPAIPLLTSRFSEEGAGLIPHQTKVRNIMRKRPDLAAWPIDAGGGKSMLTITDILYEIAAGESAPYLVMCPSHLVANYVSEIVEFTDGKVNVIPVTSYNIRTTGLERFEEILTHAPINTILVVDYDALKYRTRATVYGTTTITVYPVIELIRQFKPGYVMMDESHLLRNLGSGRMKAVMTLVADIKKKRVASGTMNPDSPSDMPGQMAILDPTIFGTRAEFNEKYGKEVKGGRVLQWQTKGPNAISTILGTVQQNIVWAPAKRKEWACALPPRKDQIIAVDLTERQQVMYDAIFDEMVSQIKKAAESGSKKAKALLEKMSGQKATKEDEDAFGDLTEVKEDSDADSEDAEDDIGPSLQPYLADIERFVTNPSGHPYARDGFVNAAGEHILPLSGDDLKAPKALMLERLMTEYFATHETKILVFVNYEASADFLYQSMSPELQACGILYKTGNKVDFVNRFKKDPKVKWMIGIRKSLEVGLNLQQAGCLIRVEGVWTPGEQEQGDARIERPNFAPGGDKRAELIFDTLVADKTIDVTKAARLRAKMVDLAKFDNPLNPAYDDENIPPIPVIPMNLDNIRSMNDFATNLAKYHHSIQALNRTVKQENEEYKQKMIAEGGFHFTSVAQAPIPPGAAMLARVPYAQGTELYKASELGLVRVDNFIGLELADEEEEEGEDIGDDEADDVESDVDDERSRIIRQQTELVVGRECHTESGDGTIIGTGAARKGNFIFRLKVRLKDGTVARNCRVTNVFIVTRTETNSVDMRNKLAEAAGLDIVGKITVPAFNVVQRRMSRKEVEDQQRKEMEKRSLLKTKAPEGLSIGLQLSIVNGYMRLAYEIGEDERAVKALEAIGFRKDPLYWMTWIRHFKHLMKQLTLWRDAGFVYSSQTDMESLKALSAELKGGGITSHKHYARLIGAGSWKNYLRNEFKPSADKTILRVFSLVTDGGDTDPAAVKEAEKLGINPHFGAAYLCLPYGPGHPSSKAAVNPSPKIKAPSSKWVISPPTLSIFVNNVYGVGKVLKQIKAAGIQVENMDVLNSVAKKIARVPTKDDPSIDVRADDKDEGGPAKKVVKRK